ncbi:hypothetical protein [Rhizobium sp. ZPR3]|uniref:Uncharacterized protein n=2 Tax=unclassified Rhizobium TaxID=2613769 RepID=A0AAU7SRV8_9HYPH
MAVEGRKLFRLSNVDGSARRQNMGVVERFNGIGLDVQHLSKNTWTDRRRVNTVDYASPFQESRHEINLGCVEVNNARDT